MEVDERDEDSKESKCSLQDQQRINAGLWRVQQIDRNPGHDIKVPDRQGQVLTGFPETTNPVEKVHDRQDI